MVKSLVRLVSCCSWSFSTQSLLIRNKLWLECAVSQFHVIFECFQTLEILALCLSMLIEPFTKLIFVVVVQVLSLCQNLWLVVCFGMERTMLKLFSLFLQVQDLRVKLLLALWKAVKQFGCLMVLPASRLWLLSISSIRYKGALLQVFLLPEGVMDNLSVLLVIRVLVKSIINWLVIHAYAWFVRFCADNFSRRDRSHRLVENLLSVAIWTISS